MVFIPMAPTKAKLFLREKRFRRVTSDTERKGIAIIHQELALVRELTVLENNFLVTK
ncbi:hypothetical protein ACLK1T_13435 [Escherichia coli]